MFARFQTISKICFGVTLNIIRRVAFKICWEVTLNFVEGVLFFVNTFVNS
nr:MAG TPA: hypothetical protein [Caudoviricetes sp.]